MPLRDSHGFHDATADPDELRAAFAEARFVIEELGVGWVPGPDFLVVDVDEKKGKSGSRTLWDRTVAAT